MRMGMVMEMTHVATKQAMNMDKIRRIRETSFILLTRYCNQATVSQEEYDILVH